MPELSIIFTFFSELFLTDKKNYVEEATSRLLWREDISRSDWLLVYLMRNFNFDSIFNKLVKFIRNFGLLVIL